MCPTLSWGYSAEEAKALFDLADLQNTNSVPVYVAATFKLVYVPEATHHTQ
jgi:hypothetical protein